MILVFRLSTTKLCLARQVVGRGRCMLAALALGVIRLKVAEDGGFGCSNVFCSVPQWLTFNLFFVVGFPIKKD